MTNANASRTRRRFLARAGLAVGASILAGCSTRGDESRAVAVGIVNRRSATESVTIRISSSDGETIDTAEYDVQSGSTRTHRLDDVPVGSYRIAVAGEGWKTTADWETSACSRFLAETTLAEGADGTPHTSLSVECRDE